MGREIQVFLWEPGHFHAVWLIGDPDSRIRQPVKVITQDRGTLGPFQSWLNQARAQGNSLPALEFLETSNPLEPIFGQPDPKLVILAGHNHRKAELASQLLKQGVPVLCDKPLWTTPKRATSLIGMLSDQDSGLLLDDCMTERLEPAFALQRKLMGLGWPELRPKTEDKDRIWAKLGNHHHLVKTVGGITVTRDPVFLDWGLYGDPFADVGVHLVDHMILLREALGQGVPLLENQGIVSSRKVLIDSRSLTRWGGSQDPTGKATSISYPLEQTWDGQGGLKGIHIESSWASAGDLSKPEGQFCALSVESGGLVAARLEDESVMGLHWVGLPVNRRTELMRRLTEWIATQSEPFQGTRVETTRYGLKLVPPPGATPSHPQRFPRVMRRFLDRVEAQQRLSWLEKQRLLAKYAISAGSPRTDLVNQETPVDSPGLGFAKPW